MEQEIDLTILKKIPDLNKSITLEIRPLAPLSMVSEIPGAFYKTLKCPSKKMICGLFENMLGWHFSIKDRKLIFNDWKKLMKKQGKDIKDYQSGSTYIPLLMDYFDIIGEPSLKNFKACIIYTDLWNRCYRRGDSHLHLNGCRNIDEKLISERHNVFAKIDSSGKAFGERDKLKTSWFKENSAKVPCYYTTPTTREYIDLNGVYEVHVSIDDALFNLLECAMYGICYLGNNEGWVDVTLKTNDELC